MENSNQTLNTVQNPQNTNMQPRSFTSSENPLPESSSNKFILWLIAGLVLIILLVGGIYFYLSKQQEVSAPVPSTSPVVQENLEDGLNVIEITNTDSDFTAIDKDLQSL